LHRLHRLIKQVNASHKGLGQLVAFNLIAAKAKKCILNVAPAGCGKSAATNVVHRILGGQATRYGSITLAGLHFLQAQFKGFTGHIIVDDLAAEKSVWARVATVSTFAHLCYSHSVSKFTQNLQIQIEGFDGSIALNIQPVLMQSLIDSDDWVSMVRDKVIRYYHLIRPFRPQTKIPNVTIDYGPPIHEVHIGKFHGKLYWTLFAKGLLQWSAARCNEHIPDLLRACTALDGRTEVDVTDYHLLDQLMSPFGLEIALVDTYGFESARTFNQNAYYMLVELASFKKLSLATLMTDYKVSESTARRLIGTVPEWCIPEGNDSKLIKPTDHAKKILEQAGIFYKW